MCVYICVCVCVYIYVSPNIHIYISRQEYWSGLPLLSLGDLLNPGIEPRSPMLQADSLLSEPRGKPYIHTHTHTHTHTYTYS